VSYGAASHTGLVRNDNQDAYGIFPQRGTAAHMKSGRIFIVADGLGGHRGGKTASTLAVKTIGEAFFLAQTSSVQVGLANALHAANSAIYAEGRLDPELHGMGTTCVALVLKNNSVFVAHAGDSRVYRITASEIRQITDDHSRVAQMVRQGALTPAEAVTHPDRHQIYRALGTHQSTEVDIQPEHKVEGEDWFLLCSDGLTNMVSDAEIRDIVIAQPPKSACKSLIALTNEKGGHDNTTVIVVHVKVD